MGINVDHSGFLGSFNAWRKFVILLHGIGVDQKEIDADVSAEKFTGAGVGRSNGSIAACGPTAFDPRGPGGKRRKYHGAGGPTSFIRYHRQENDAGGGQHFHAVATFWTRRLERSH